MKHDNLVVLDDCSGLKLQEWIPSKSMEFNVGGETKITFTQNDDNTLDVKVYGNYEESVKAFADYLKKVFDGVTNL